MKLTFKDFPGGIRYEHVAALREMFKFQPAKAGDPANRDLLCIQTGWQEVITTLEAIAAHQAHGAAAEVKTGAEDEGFASRMKLKGSQADVLQRALSQAGG